MQPLFSIVIPTYNQAKKLQRAIESVLRQSNDDFEILVMDDGSRDNTGAVVASFADSRITYTWEENFGGPARPRNRGIGRAKGEWICFLDADDWWAKDKLRACLACINANVDLVYHPLRIVSEQRRMLRRKQIKSWQVGRPVLIDLLVNGNAIATSSVVVRKSLLEKIGGVNESVEMIASEDYNTWLRVAKVTDNFLYLPRTLGYYTHDQQSLSHKDMSVPERHAVAEFSSVLSAREQRKIEARLKYGSGKFQYVAGNYVEATSALIFSAQYGNMATRLKSILLLTHILLKK